MALLLLCATFPLIWVGGLVTSYDAGMAVPDWPGTYGYNLFLYPWQSWIAGPWDLFIEHGHRLLGAAVGLLAIALVVVTFCTDRRVWVRAVVIAALVLVVFQGALGGQRVLLDDRRIAQLHGCVGPLFFSWCMAVSVWTSRWWRTASCSGSEGLGGLATAAWFTVALAAGQLLLGSQLRHVSGTTPPGFFAAAVVFHIVLAVVITVQSAAVCFRAYRIRGPQARVVRRPATALLALVVCQLSLGAGSWLVTYGWPSIFSGWQPLAGWTLQAESLFSSLIVTAHVATGALILAASVSLALRAARLNWLATGRRHIVNAVGAAA